MSDRGEELSQLERALHALRQMRARLDAVERARSEPIAVVGLACRFPGGADSPAAFWRLLVEGRDGVSEVPPDRWSADATFDADPDAVGKLATRWGGFIGGVDLFDADFFGIAPREAAQMDPQQRLLLETGWEALDDAGRPPDGLAGSATGVFVGVHSHSSDYGLLQMRALEDVGTYTSTGTAHSILANRLSYLLDLRGPSLAVDTACSSSLVAVHLAVQSLRAGECDLALAGGVNLLLSPEVTASLSRMRMMAADGRCKTFDAAADGFVRGEGCGVVVLKRLSAALADGDRIRALIAGTAVNQDGTTNGLTAPNGLSQQEVVRRALRDGRVDPASVGFVETHGTGTALGDPIEVEALAETLGRAGDAPCLLGAVKSNLGHLEGAAGIAGLIKAVLALEHATIPPNLHFRELNPHISLAGTRLALPTRAMPWPAGTGRHAGVSSFGFGGTNAHMVLGEAPVRGEERGKRKEERETGTLDSQLSTLNSAAEHPQLLAISARSEPALREFASRYVELLGSSPPPLRDLCYTAAARRTHHAHRIAVVGDCPEAFLGALGAYLRGEEADALVLGRSDSERRRRLVMVFSGQGSQWAGMGRDLIESEPVFREAIEECDRAFQPLAGWSIREAITATAERSRLDRTEVAQPAIFAVQVALAALWRSWGIVPDAVIGHSVGEVAAAHVAGALSLADAVRVIHHRGRVMQPASGRGRMAAVGLPRAAAEELAARSGGAVAVAAVNSPGSCVLSGDATAVEAAVRGLEERGVFTRLLEVDLASHSAQMEAPRDELVRSLDGLASAAPSTRVYSTVTGRVADPDAFGAAYWGRNLREPVLFAEAVAAALDGGATDFLEVAPHPLLRAPIEQCADDRDAGFAGSLHRDLPGREAMLRSLAALHVRGYRVEWAALWSPPGHVVALPSYPWQRRRLWIDVPDRTSTARGAAAEPAPAEALELPGRLLTSPALRAAVFESRLSASSAAFLGDHRIGGDAVAPASLVVELLLSAACRGFGDASLVVEELALVHPLPLPDEGARVVHSILQPPTDGRASWELHSRSGDDEAAWVLHASATVRAGSPVVEGSAEPSPPAHASTLGGADAAGIVGVVDVLPDADGTVARLRFVLGADHLAPSLRRAALLDACFRLASGIGPAQSGDRPAPFVVAGIGRLHAAGKPTAEAVCRIQRVNGAVDAGFAATLEITGADGDGRIAVEGLRFARISTALDPELRTGSWHKEVVWRPRGILGHATQRPAMELPNFGELVGGIGARDAAPGAGAAKGALTGGLAGGLDRASTAYVVAALREIGVALQPGDVLTPDAVAETCGAASHHRRLLRRLFGMLEEDGILERRGDGWLVGRPVGEEDVASTVEMLARRYPAHAAELDLFGRCGRALADVLRGRADPLDLLFPTDGEGGAERLYYDAPLSLGANLLVRDAVASVVARLPRDRAIRVLEIGAGTGGTAAHLLPALPPERTEYLFTDVSRALIDRAAERLRHHRAARYEVFDVERDPESQGFAPGQFDIVVAANVLHATVGAAAALRHAGRLLAPGGVLLLLEGVRPARWIDLVFGLTPGWWRFADTDRREEHPLLPAEAWTALLRETGFAEVEAIAAPDAAGERIFEQALLMARTPSAAAAGDAGHESTAAAAVAGGRWLVFSDGAGVGDRLAEAVRARGGDCTVVSHASDGSDPSDEAGSTLHLDPERPEKQAADLVGRWAAESPDAAGPRTVVVLGNPDGGAEELQSGVTATCALLASVARALTEGPAGARLWIATRGAQPVASGDTPDPAQAALWGFGRGLALEAPEIWGGLVDLDPASDPREAAADLLAQVAATDGEDQAALRQGLRYVPRLADAEPGGPDAIALQPDAAYLVTGGLGDLGLRLARWLAERGARHIVLTGRSGLPERDRWDALPAGSRVATRVHAIRKIEALGAAVHPVAADTADADAMQRLLGRFGAELPPLRGVFHVAGVMEFDALPRLDAGRIDAVLRPKVAGAWTLHRLTRDLDLDHFVLFSSVAGLWGSRGMAHYAAANAFLDALAHHRRALGLPALAVDWGGWEGGDAGRDANRFLAASDFRLMPPAAALDALGAAMAAGVAQRAVAWVDWDSLRSSYELRGGRPFLREIDPVEEVPAGTPHPVSTPAPTALLDRLRLAGDDEALSLLTAHVRSEVAAVLGLDESRLLEPGQGFFKLGMDSLMTVELRGRLERGVGIRLPTTIAFEYPTVETLAGYLAGRIRVGGEGRAGATSFSVVAGGAPTPAAAVVDADLDSLSEDDLAALLDGTVADLLDDEAPAR
jgi:acyl transferase domain-containing protein/protein-L-isoaspartate O-methyltransferase